MTTTMKPKLWVPGDWNAFFGFGTNILVNLLTLTALLRFVLKMPDEMVFGRILPAVGLMMFLSTGYYAFLAYRLAKKTGRTDVCALPSGISVPHMFIVTFVVMLPIGLKTGDPMKAWSAASSCTTAWWSWPVPISSDRRAISPFLSSCAERTARLPPGTSSDQAVPRVSLSTPFFDCRR